MGACYGECSGVGAVGLAHHFHSVQVPLVGGGGHRRSDAGRVGGRLAAAGAELYGGGAIHSHHEAVLSGEGQCIAVARAAVVGGVGAVVVRNARGQTRDRLSVLIVIACTNGVVVAWIESMHRTRHHCCHNHGEVRVETDLEALSRDAVAPAVVQDIAMQGGGGAGDIVSPFGVRDGTVGQQLSVGGNTRPADELTILVYIRFGRSGRRLTLFGDTVHVLREPRERRQAEQPDEQCR